MPNDQRHYTGANHNDAGAQARAKRLVNDPVCGMAVDPATASNTLRYGGEVFYFCSARCKAKFEAGPAQYAVDDTSPQMQQDAHRGYHQAPTQTAGQPIMNITMNTTIRGMGTSLMVTPRP